MKLPFFFPQAHHDWPFYPSKTSAQGGLFVKANAASMKQHLKILWFKFCAAVGGRFCPGFIVHLYLPFSDRN